MPPLDTAPSEANVSSFQAIPPTGTFSFAKLRRNQRGNAIALTIDVSGPGSVVLFGKKVQKVSRTATDAGPVTLMLRLKQGIVVPPGDPGRTKVNVTYTPSGGSPVGKAIWVTLR